LTCKNIFSAPQKLNDTVVLVLSILGAIGAAMAFMAWRIKRLQYPPHLRWPTEKEKKKARRQSHRQKDDSDKS
jgi:hypothetical protein